MMRLLFTSVTPTMEAMQQEMRDMFTTLAVVLWQWIMARVDTEPALPELQPPEPGPGTHHSNIPPPPKPDQAWDLLNKELPTYPPPPEESWPKLHKLARELKRKAALMTAGRHLHDIHTVLHLVSAWEHLSDDARAYAADWMHLLYIAVTKGWPAALY
jgi:hypothetical protein